MENLLADHLDRESDYGSDFSPDEELLLSQLLQRVPPTLRPNPEPDNNIRGDLEENEDIDNTAISHTIGKGPGDKGHPTLWKIAARKTRTSISVEGYGSSYTDRRWHILWSHATN